MSGKAGVIVVVAAGLVLAAGAGPSRAAGGGSQPMRDHGRGHWFHRACSLPAAASRAVRRPGRHRRGRDSARVADSAGGCLRADAVPHRLFAADRVRGGHAPDDRDRRCLRRPERRGRPRDVRLELRPAGLHDRERMLQEGQPDRRYELPGGRLGLGARDLARRRDSPRDLPELPHPPRRGQLELARPTSAPPRTRRPRSART